MPPADAKGWTVDGPSSRSALEIAREEREEVRESLLDAEDELADRERKYYRLLDELQAREEWLSPTEAARQRERVRALEVEVGVARKVLKCLEVEWEGLGGGVDEGGGEGEVVKDEETSPSPSPPPPPSTSSYLDSL